MYTRICFLGIIWFFALPAFSQSSRDASFFRSKGYQVFPEYSVAIKVPVILKDVSRQSKENHAFDYAAMADENLSDKTAFYQIIIDRLPAGYKDSSAKKKEEFYEKMYTLLSGDKKKVVFGIEKLPAIVMTYSFKGMAGKGIIIFRNGFNYGFNIMTNYKLTERFNEMTNKIEFL